MRIVKYLFLLFLLSLVALSIFIATQKGEFRVKKSMIINSQKSTAFSYANELKNWEDWYSLAVEDSLLNIKYSNKTVGRGSFCSWEGKEGYGDLKIINLKENDNILQKINFNGNSADVLMVFKDTLGKTKVTLNAKGKMNFTSKIWTLFYDIDHSIGFIFEKSLTNLDKKLDYEINTYNVNINGVVKKLEAFYLAQKFTSKFSNIGKNSRIVFSKITTFCNENNIKVNGKPFVIYHTYDTINKQSKISVCIPITTPIFISQGSEILSDTLKSFEAVKTTLRGDYTHTIKALKKTSEYFKKNNLKLDSKFSHLEVYSIGKNEINSPSKWKTEIYFPLRPKIVYKKPALNTVTTEKTVPKPIQEMVNKKPAVNPVTTEKTVPKPIQEKEIPSEF